MDHKTWLWRKKSSEKTIFATDKVGNPLRRIEEVIRAPFSCFTLFFPSLSEVVSHIIVFNLKMHMLNLQFRIRI